MAMMSPRLSPSNSTFKVLLLLFWLSFSGAVSGQEHIDRLKQLDVQHYQFRLQLNDTSDVVRGEAEITITFLEDTREFDLDLVAYDDWSGKGMEITSISQKGRPVKFNQDEDHFAVILSKRIWKDNTETFTVKYQGIPEDGLVIGENKFGDRTFFGENWPDMARQWLPTVDHPSDKASVEFIITAPEHYRVIANGVMMSETSSGPFKTTHWSETKPLPTKVMVFGAARFSVEQSGQIDDIPVTTWVFPQNAEDGFHDFSNAPKILEFYVNLIGPYPYKKLANVQSKTRFGGMENASNIFYFENSVNGKQEREYLIAHEIVHQWFGNSASEANWHHIWLSEGFAVYLTHMFAEEMEGDLVIKERLRADRDKVVDYYKTNPAPVVDPSVVDYRKLLNPNSYQKGGWVLHMLRNKVGDENFRKGIRQYYNQYQFSNALTSDFQLIMEVVSGQSLTNFFEQWILNGGHPVLTLDWQQQTNKVVLDIGQTQDDLFDFDLTVELQLADGRVQTEGLRISNREQSFEIALTEQISKILWDPDVQLLWEPAE